MDLRRRLRVKDEIDLLTRFALLFAFFLPISISIAQPFAYLAIATWGYVLWRHPEERRSLRPFALPIILFSALLLFSSVIGPNPGYSVAKCRRLILLAVVFIVGNLFRSDRSNHSRSVLTPLLCFVAGSTVLGLWDIVRVPFEVAHGTALYDTGNMRDPQLYLVSLCILLALRIYRPIQIPPYLMSLLITVNMVGMILHFKRGVWIAFACVAVLIGGWTRRYRLLAIVCVGIVVLLLVPQTRDRLTLLQEEFTVKTGGRYVLWTQVAPRMIADHPLGVGMRALEYDDFLAYSKHLQPGLNHLHNNLLQVTVDAGWLGALVWIYWMGLAWWLMARLSMKYKESGTARAAVALACLAAFTGVMLNGMVEYNFGNSVIFMVIVLLLGQTHALYHIDEGPE